MVSSLAKGQVPDTWSRTFLKDVFVWQQAAEQIPQTDTLPPVLRVVPPFHHEGSETTDSIKRELNRIKRQLYPVVGTQYKNDPDSIAETAQFVANPVQNFTPMDNAMAVNPQGLIVSVVNANLCVFDTSGNRLLFRNFVQVAADPSLRGRIFDPRVLYEPVSGRFFVAVLHGITAAESRILLFVSKSTNPLDGWHYYKFTGDPRGEKVFADYPHITVNGNTLWITVNHFGDGDQKYRNTGIYSIDKAALLNGQNTHIRYTNSITTLEDKKVFNLVPATDTDGTSREGAFFLCSEDRGGDRIHLFYLDAMSNTLYRYAMEIDRYSIGSDAVQPGTSDLLNTGDCRITGAYLRDGIIHFCLNARGQKMRNAILYGRVDVSNGVLAYRMISQDRDLAYGFPIPFARAKNNRSSLVSLVYCSETEHASVGVVFVDHNLNPHELIAVWKGLASRESADSDIARWGDYCGGAADPVPLNPGAWVCAAGVNADGNWINVISRLQGDTDTLDQLVFSPEVRVFPNPVTESIRIRVDLEQSARVGIALFDSKGALVRNLWEGVLVKGINSLIFDPGDLAPGIYTLRILDGNTLIHSERLLCP